MADGPRANSGTRRQAFALGHPLRPAVMTQPLIPWLVIGYGNTLRRDDGAGVRVAEAVEQWALPGVQVLLRHQLAPELADALARAARVVFVDAAAGEQTRPAWRPLRPAPRAAPLAHAADPRALLLLARALFGRAPRAWLLTLPAPDLGYGEGLSPLAAAGAQAALLKLRRQLTAAP